MSTRQIRRLVAIKEKEKQNDTKEVKQENDSKPADEMRLPYSVQVNLYDGLEVSSSDESTPTAVQDEAGTVIPEEDKYGAIKKIPSSNKHNKKKKKNKVDKKSDKFDEVEWSVREVNRMLGTLPNISDEKFTDDINAVTEKKIFNINPLNIDVNYELAKVFGEENTLKKIRQNGTRRMRRAIGLSPDIDQYQLKGLTMALINTNEDIKYFKFRHTLDYQKRCADLILAIRATIYQGSRHEKHLYANNCVEALLENFDVLYDAEEHKKAKECVEEAIHCMQVVGDQTFNYVDGKCRVEYEYVENRPFLLAILKYLHTLTNVACHRTALELAKVLINLDPSDPLAVIFIIDTLAIRAQEYQWLLDLIELWREKRQAHRLFHMRYSRSLALFHIAYEKNDDDGIEKATEALMKSITLFPQVAFNILEFSKIHTLDEIKNHAIFTPSPNITVPHDFNELMTLYSWLIAPRWKDPQVWKWFIETVRKQIALYDSDPKTSEKQKKVSATHRAQLYRRLPTQIRRHMYAIRPMASYISEGRIPYTVPSIAFNPFPLESSCIDTYGYFTNWVTRYEPAKPNQ